MSARATDSKQWRCLPGSAQDTQLQSQDSGGIQTADPAALHHTWGGVELSDSLLPPLLASSQGGSFFLTCPALLASSHPQAEQTCFMSASTPTSDENPPEGRESRRRANTMRTEIIGPVKKKSRGDRGKNEEHLGLCGYH